jgi:ELWxxDGT repeat protein
MPAKRSLTLALALLLVAAIPARATGFPTITVVDEIRPGSDTSQPMWSTGRLGDWLYFPADDGSTGSELWRTNGTVTSRVADINTAPGGSSYPQGFTALGDWLYFAADDGTNGTELWRTNGAITEDLPEILVGVDSANIAQLTELNGWLYFGAQSALYGYQLHRTNGTAIEMVDVILEGTRGNSPNYLTVLGDWLYFTADTGTLGPNVEVWRTNGTSTTRVTDINPQSDSTGGGSDPSGLTTFGNFLYFSANDGSTGRELWRTNGTVTTQAADIYNDGYSNPAEFAEFNGYLYFQAEDGTNGTELWRTNGSAVEQVRNITAGGASSYPELFTVLGNYLYFRTSNLSFYELWRTDGTTAGTTVVEDIIPDAGQTLWGLTALGDYLYFVANNETSYQIYRTNTAGLMEVGVVPGTTSGVGCECSQPLVALDGRLFMQMFSDEAGWEFAYLDERTFGLPGTNRDGSVWSTALVLLAAVTAVAGVGLRMRGAPRS